MGIGIVRYKNGGMVITDVETGVKVTMPAGLALTTQMDAYDALVYFLAQCRNEAKERRKAQL